MKQIFLIMGLGLSVLAFAPEKAACTPGAARSCQIDPAGHYVCSYCESISQNLEHCCHVHITEVDVDMWCGTRYK